MPDATSESLGTLVNYKYFRFILLFSFHIQNATFPYLFRSIEYVAVLVNNVLLGYYHNYVAYPTISELNGLQQLALILMFTGL